MYSSKFALLTFRTFESSVYEDFALSTYTLSLYYSYVYTTYVIYESVSVRLRGLSTKGTKFILSADVGTDKESKSCLTSFNTDVVSIRGAGIGRPLPPSHLVASLRCTKERR